MSADFEPDALLKHVLCAVDLSSCSVAALSRAIQLADVYGARLDVLHILDASDTARGLLKSRRDDLLLHLQQIVEGTLDRQQISVTTSIAHGDPVREILSHLRQHMSDLLVIGSCSSSRPRPFESVGHTARALIAAARCPVLIASEKAVIARRSAPTTIGGIVCAISSGASPGTLKHASSLALRLGARLTIVHVLLDAGRKPSEADSELRKLRGAIPAAVYTQCGVDELVVHGTPADEIIHITRTLGPDILVLGFRSDFLSGNTRDAIVSDVLRDSSCDVLVVPVVADTGKPSTRMAVGQRTVMPAGGGS